MDQLNYTFRPNMGDLRNDIAEKLAKTFPNMPLTDRLSLAENSITQLASMGNSALHQGLVMYGAEIIRINHRYEKSAQNQ
ncbi:MAG: hypothetical protein CMH62_00400 [Nanoarchaeota archaeon]|nr:hypothetical protein [Nanoarchaeota archaeon]|tara:strand:- start:1081 stop:1320 length:240 start_codon:yes stop_codon:yes gene_type:complete